MEAEYNIPDCCKDCNKANDVMQNKELSIYVGCCMDCKDFFKAVFGEIRE